MSGVTFLFLVLTVQTVFRFYVTGRTFTVDYDNRQFLKDGKPFLYVSGSIHYFRVPREYWRDRLHKLKMAGLNAVSTYIIWSGHEPEPGQYHFGDNYDLEAFLKLSEEMGLLVILRPGPYICGEVDNGGLPYWLLTKHPDMKYRSLDTNYTGAVDRWFNHLLPRMAHYLYKNGGPIIAVQVENEYGHYVDCDKKYMEYMIRVLEKHLGHDVVYLRTDAVSDTYYACDYVRTALVSGCAQPGSAVSEIISKISSNQPIGGAPVTLSEYYTGWMSYWSWKQNPGSAESIVSTFEAYRERNVSVNFYMFHGGTNFGFLSALSGKWPITTSYDYGAPLTEAGDPRLMYYMIRNATAKYLPLPKGDPPTAAPKMSIANVTLTECISLLEVMHHFRAKGWLKNATSEAPLTFERLGQNFGFLLYRTKVAVQNSTVYTVALNSIKDRAYIFDNTTKKFSYVMDENAEVTITINTGDELVILVENWGRQDYGTGNRDPKVIFRICPRK